MLDQGKTRFRDAAEALRFFFRIRELLHSERTKGLASEVHVAAGPIAGDALHDYRSIGWSMRGLDEIALWLLRELYGPTAFGVGERFRAPLGRARRSLRTADSTCAKSS